MNESEQAQAIVEIKSIREAMADKRNAHAFDEHSMRAVLSLVDSQAQKITELYALFQKAGNGAVDLAMKCAEQAKELAEARAIAEKMRDRSERPGGGHAFLPWEKQ